MHNNLSCLRLQHARALFRYYYIIPLYARHYNIITPAQDCFIVDNVFIFFTILAS